MSFFGQIICCSESGVYSIGTFGNRTGGTARAIRSKKLRNYWSRDLLLRHTSAFMVPRITDNPFFIIFFSLLLSTFNKTNVQCQLPYYWDKKAAQFRFITEGRGGEDCLNFPISKCHISSSICGTVMYILFSVFNFSWRALSKTVEKLKQFQTLILRKIWSHQLRRHIATSSINKSFKMIGMSSYINLPSLASSRSTSTKL